MVASPDHARRARGQERAREQATTAGGRREAAGRERARKQARRSGPRATAQEQARARAAAGDQNQILVGSLVARAPQRAFSERGTTARGRDVQRKLAARAQALFAPVRAQRGGPTKPLFPPLNLPIGPGQGPRRGEKGGREAHAGGKGAGAR